MCLSSGGGSSRIVPPQEGRELAKKLKYVLIAQIATVIVSFIFGTSAISLFQIIAVLLCYYGIRSAERGYSLTLLSVYVSFTAFSLLLQLVSAAQAITALAQGPPPSFEAYNIFPLGGRSIAVQAVNISFTLGTAGLLGLSAYYCLKLIKCLIDAPLGGGILSMRHAPRAGAGGSTGAGGGGGLDHPPAPGMPPKEASKSGLFTGQGRKLGG